MTARVYLIAADTPKPIRFANADKATGQIEALIEIVEIRDLVDGPRMREIATQFHHYCNRSAAG